MTRLLDDSEWEWRRRGPTRRSVRAIGVRESFASRKRLMGSLVTHVERVRPVVDAVLARAVPA